MCDCVTCKLLALGINYDVSTYQGSLLICMDFVCSAVKSHQILADIRNALIMSRIICRSLMQLAATWFYLVHVNYLILYCTWITTTFHLSSLNDLEVMQCIGNIDPRVSWSLVQLSLWFPVILFSFAYRINAACVVLKYAMSNTFLPNVYVVVRCVIRLQIMPCLNTVIFLCFALPMFVLMQLQKYCVIARYLRNRLFAAM